MKITPELKAHMIAIAIERGFVSEPMTPEQTASVMREALRRIDCALERVQDSPRLQSQFFAAVYHKIHANNNRKKALL